MNAGLTIQVRREPGCAIVTVAGEIDIATVARLRQRLNTLADSGRHVVADLDQVGFMDASGLGASRRATAHGSSFQVVCDRRQTASCSASPGSTARSSWREPWPRLSRLWRPTGQHKDDPAMGVR